MAFPEGMHERRVERAAAEREQAQNDLERLKDEMNMTESDFKILRDSAYRDYHLLTDMQRKFVEQFLRVGNASAAARMAGYKTGNAAIMGMNLLRNVKIARIIEVKRREAADVYGLSREKMISELNEIKKIAMNEDTRNLTIYLKAFELQAKMMGYTADNQVNTTINQDTSVHISLGGGKKFNPDKAIDFNNMTEDAEDVDYTEENDQENNEEE